MNVRCPSCETLYRVDPAKVPKQGVQARCAACPAVISVIHLPSDASTPAIPGLPAAPVGTGAGAFVPPPLVAAESAVESLVEPPAPTRDAASSDHDAALPMSGFDEFSIPDVGAPPNAVEPLPAVEPIFSETPDLKASPPAEELPSVPEAPTAMDLADIEIPAPEPEPTDGMGFEAIPDAEVPQGPPPRRYTRPFLRPPEQKAPPQAAAPAGPMRPTAPVFRPTPGMPIHASPAPEPVARPLQRAPVPEKTATEHVVVPESRPRAPVNPFLSKDPKQKARRLARALVSDMIVYQPQKRQDALAAGTLKEAFEEEIKKSWEEYVDQIGQELADSTEFFKQALNEILAGGHEIF